MQQIQNKIMRLQVGSKSRNMSTLELLKATNNLSLHQIGIKSNWGWGWGKRLKNLSF